jgi:hypothetical protein
MANATTVDAARENVTTFYRVLLRREPDAVGLTGWVDAFVNLIDSHGFDFERAKTEIHNAFVNSDEYKALQQQAQQTTGATNMPPPALPLTEADFDVSYYRLHNPDAAAVEGTGHPLNTLWKHFVYCWNAGQVRKWRNATTGQSYTGATSDAAAGGGGGTTTGGDTAGGLSLASIPKWVWAVVGIAALWAFGGDDN